MAEAPDAPTGTPTTDAAAARDRFRDQVEAKGHAVENVRAAVAGLR